MDHQSFHFAFFHASLCQLWLKGKIFYQSIYEDTYLLKWLMYNQASIILHVHKRTIDFIV